VLFAFNQGEVCTCPSRALIQEDIYEEFIARAIARVKAIKQGDPRLSDTMVGAQASRQQQDKILSYLQIGVEEGAEVLVGGAAARFNGDLANGFYIQPTILKGHNKMRVFQEEIFGPVAPISTFATEDDAVALANGTPFGLISYVFTENLSRSLRLSERIETGMLAVNAGVISNPAAPFGGVKHSGLGREGSVEGMEEFLETVYVGIADPFAG